MSHVMTSVKDFLIPYSTFSNFSFLEPIIKGMLELSDFYLFLWGWGFNNKHLFFTVIEAGMFQDQGAGRCQVQ